MTDLANSPIRRWFGAPTAVHVSLLSPEARSKVGNDEYIARHDLRDLMVGADWRAEWESALARGKEIEAVTIGKRATALAEGVVPTVGGQLVRRAIDAGARANEAITKALRVDKSASDLGKAAVGATLSTPLTRSGVVGDVVFSTATNVAEALLRSGKLDDTEEQVDTGTAIAYDVASGTAAGVVGTIVGVAATPPAGIAAAVAMKLGIDAIRDPVIWRAAEVVAGVRAALGLGTPR